MENESIEQGTSEAASIDPGRGVGATVTRAARSAAGAMPDWCNLGIALRIVLGVNAVIFAVCAVMSDSFDTWETRSLTAAISVEPVLLATICTGCLIRSYFQWVNDTVQIITMLIFPLVFTVVMQTALAPVLLVSTPMMMRNGLVAAAICGLVMYWSYLRHQANFPAVTEARLQALQARIRPHFLFNSLNAVLGMIRTDPRRAETALEDLADLFRVLMRDQRERIPLREEIALCQSYLDIESLRLGDRLDVAWQIDIEATPTLVPSLLLQPLIENAVHHGIEPSIAPGTIEIAARRVGNFVEIVISNPYLASEPLRAGNQIGLNNVRQRLTLLFDIEGRLDTAVRDGRYIVQIRIPFAER